MITCNARGGKILYSEIAFITVEWFFVSKLFSSFSLKFLGFSSVSYLSLLLMRFCLLWSSFWKFAIVYSTLLEQCSTRFQSARVRQNEGNTGTRSRIQHKWQPRPQGQVAQVKASSKQKQTTREGIGRAVLNFNQNSPSSTCALNNAENACAISIRRQSYTKTAARRNFRPLNLPRDFSKAFFSQWVALNFDHVSLTPPALTRSCNLSPSNQFKTQRCKNIFPRWLEINTNINFWKHFYWKLRIMLQKQKTLDLRSTSSDTRRLLVYTCCYQHKSADHTLTLSTALATARLREVSAL